MFTKVLIICAVAVAAFAVELPPGIHPALCPNYPNCDMELLAHHQTFGGVPIANWELPYARMMPGAGVWPYVANTGFEYPLARMMPVPVKVVPVVPEKTPVVL